ncbi:TIGR03620 family F420-dependent LLM class oxidoreductase [Acidiferrimicrobium sp. IK]|uniref:TIGR03620 family F420-dependent LLM class oxidoreductase n=1 Tax=Acidiferrimicrobium sp. IK TaxID=2871700 RepID=UPI0021CB5CFD|nr:TIGR03620 family F420-dependent LLM class oxidoreductase [Acidiferrimicrobium sp. IK]MCU4183214.1 TIGR03620 family F420-dependent LLM class oxidoreductase [Acidiferrimicrobium sp. IK]
MSDSGHGSETGTVDWTRTRLGPVGVWTGLLRAATISEERAAVSRIEDLGYGSLWTGELIGGKEAFSHAAIVLAASTTLVAGTGIANLWARHPAAMQGGASTIGAAWPGRFVLGVGVSHAPIVDGSGQRYVKPLERMARYLDAMDAAAADAPVTSVAVPRVLAALRPKMLELARDRADGAHPYFVPPEHTPAAREALGPDKLLIPEQAVVLSTDPAEARRVARRHMHNYLLLPNYVNNLKHLGYSDEDVSGGGSDRLVDAIVAWGDEADIAERVTLLRDSGADHVLLQPLATDLAGALPQLEALAPAVLG